ncbi:hypothetical protein EMPS_05604 [Entomortierella parvispora]|uniref:Uncharacterized protein n=1 Tax=Entomortierella parvispora TaxID=205924 RepID=A0A9P3HAX6_9FUNG|nr:hypothetical protein EMPS_05604 [Entomortierella parvispora]
MTKGTRSNAASPSNKARGNSGSYFLKKLFPVSTASKLAVAKGTLEPSLVSIVSAVPGVFSFQVDTPSELSATGSAGYQPPQPDPPTQQVAQSTTTPAINNDIFPRDDIVKTEKENSLPNISDRITDTLQLTFCASLLLQTREGPQVA